MQKRVVLAVALVCSLACALFAVAGAEESPFRLEKTLQLPDEVRGVAFSPDGALMAVSLDNCDIQLISTATWSLASSQIPGHCAWEAIRFSPDGALIALYGEVRALDTGSTVWDGSDGSTVNAFSPDGRLFVVGSDPVTVWNVDKWTLRLKIYSAQRGQPNAMVLTGDGQVLLCAPPGTGTIERWDTTTGSLLASVPLSGHPFLYSSVAGFSPDGQLLGWLSFLSGAVTLWDVASGMRIGEVPVEAFLTADFTFLVGSRFIAAGVGPSVLIATVPKGATVGRLDADPAGVTVLASSADGTRLAVGGRTGRIDVWDVSALLPYHCTGFTISKVDWAKGCVTVKNSTSGPLDLVGWKISDGDKAFTFEASIPVEAGESYVACSAVYNPSNSNRGLRIDETDDQVSLYSPEICGSTKEGTKRQ